MAKLRFPGKALKLNLRKRIRFRDDYEVSPEEIRALQIKRGLILFRNVFGDSDEDDECDFEGFGLQGGDGKISHRKQLRQSRKAHLPLPLKKERVTESNQQPPQPMCEKTNNLPPIAHKESPTTEHAANDINDHSDSTKPQTNNSRMSLIEKLNKEKKAKLLSQLHLSRQNASAAQLKKLKLKNNAFLARRAHVITRKSLLSKKKLKKKFILPSVSVRSSRVIIPNKRLFSDITAICSTTRQTEIEETKAPEVETRRQLRAKKEAPVNASFNAEDSLEDKDEVCRSITLYTDSITEQFRGQVGRPPKRLTRRTDADSLEDLCGTSENFSPSKDSKEDRVKEKIEKLLRSPWDNRLKPNKKERDDEENLGGVTSAKSILRKARLNLNKKTLQKIRSPSSVQQLIPVQEEDSTEVKCSICRSNESVVRRYGASCCSACSDTITNAIDGSFKNLECIGTQGECQLVGLSSEERCSACWLSRILLLCTVPSLLHDRLRKQLPPILKDKVPSSLGRSNNIHSKVASEVETSDQLKRHLSTDSSGVFGSVIDLPGGWKRRTGPEVIVISPSGEKFKSIAKLEDYLKRQGVAADPRILFGNPSVSTFQVPDTKPSLKVGAKLNHKPQVVVTTLPGGWSRRIKWRHSGDKFDTYVCSPDGRTFRSRKELSAYFLQIGKVDDIHKYFPLKNANTCINSSDHSETSSTEPSSSSEICSEMSADERSPDVPSETEAELRSTKSNEKDSLPSCLKGANSKVQVNNEENCADISLNSSPLSKKSPGKIIISDFTAAFEFSKAPGDSSLPPNPPQADLSNPPEDKLKNSSFDSGRITLLSFSDSNALNEKDDCRRNNEMEYIRVSFKDCLARKFLSQRDSLPQPLLPEKSQLKNKKKKRKKKNLNKDSEGSEKVEVTESRKDEPEPIDKPKSSNENLRRSSRFKPTLDDKEDSESTADKSKHMPKPSDANELEVPLICDVDKIEANVKEITKEASPLNERMILDDFSKYSTTNETAAASELVNCSTKSDNNGLASAEDTPPFSGKPCADATLEDPKAEVVEKKPARAPIRRKKIKRRGSKEPSTEKEKVTKRIKKLSSFTKESFGCNWSRKIKWNDKGEGKVAFLTSPEGQRIVSTIELLAYFKKAGRPIHNIEYYFPSNLVHPSNEDNDSKAKSSFNPISSQENADNLARESSQALFNDSNRLNKKRLKLHPIKKSRQEVLLRKRKLNRVKGFSEKSAPSIPIGGPRVKHVCRSQAQVLGMARAVFPSPEKLATESKPVEEEESKDANINKLPKKTLWCGKCPGCTTPNCQRCSNCLNMKKFGGPGTKKKPCILRKCINPTPSLKSGTVRTFIPKKPKSQPPKDSLEALAPEIVSCAPHFLHNGELEDEAEEPEEGESDGENARVLKDWGEDGPIYEPVGSELHNDRDGQRQDEGGLCDLERPVFVPRQMYKITDGKQDQRSDIQMGKELTPGARVNIDYWQGYDAEEMLLCGFPIISSNLMDLGTYCFRCGSRGKEPLFFCAYCCEGVHPFCMEEDEGPESEMEEFFWICRRCIVCHVCGGSGHDSLMQCSSCRLHYHLECLGPSSHTACQSQQTWEADVLGLLSHSWPRQTPILDVSEPCESDAEVRVYEDLERLSCDEAFPVAKKQPFHGKSFCLNFPLRTTVSSSKNSVVESVLIDYSKNLETEAGPVICLEDELKDEYFGFDDFLDGVNEMIQLYQNVDLDVPPCINTCKGDVDPNVASLGDDEYLTLGYSKILPFQSSETEVSLFKLLQRLQKELFSISRYPFWPEDSSRCSSRTERKATSDTDTTSEGKKDDNSDYNFKDILKVRRSEMHYFMKEIEERKLADERKKRETERGRCPKKRKVQSTADTCASCNLTISECKCPNSSNVGIKLKPTKKAKAPATENFLIYDAKYDHLHPSHLWQPSSWEEFESLFPSSQSKDREAASNHEDVEKKDFHKEECAGKRILSPTSEERARKKICKTKCLVQMEKLDIPVELINSGVSFITSEDCEELGETMEPDPPADVQESIQITDGVDLSPSEEGIVLEPFDEDSRGEFEEVISYNAAQVVLEVSSQNENSIEIGEIGSPSSLENGSSASPLIEDIELQLDDEKSQVIEELPAPPDATYVEQPKRSRRSTFGRASQLASMRKALLDM